MTSQWGRVARVEMPNNRIMTNEEHCTSSGIKQPRAQTRRAVEKTTRRKQASGARNGPIGIEIPQKFKGEYSGDGSPGNKDWAESW